MMKMKHLWLMGALSMAPVVASAQDEAKEAAAKEGEKTEAKAEVPANDGHNYLLDYFKVGESVEAFIGVVVPPNEINKYMSKVQEAAVKDPEWHREYAASNPPGRPLPYHEKLGLSKDDYEQYIKLWGERQFKAMAKVFIEVQDKGEDKWAVRVSGAGMPISLLRYFPKKNELQSPNGVLTRLKDIDADKESILGAWAGQEWKYEGDDGYIMSKENFAIGKKADGKHGYLIYRLQQSVSGGEFLGDDSIVIRFPLTK
ncbi:hypothetical protein [Persicirhabdus sediminis]|uniref:Uncharacterized protein n=1 Tax=Persicirhabdus sediminis TaxID=454144 RepID=A0A8J7SLZ6_9BACT|nr:hypothetical protein [Persicirhabdus sediminis]MBK1792656.1 hypothetical protein [Persicirhabdus sediminis]